MATDTDFTPISDIGEFGLIDRMSQILGRPSSDELLVGISDDAAVYRIDDHRCHVVTTDVLIEGVHFDPLFMPMEYLGNKSIAVNVSDVAAMNAEPRYATIGLGVPEAVSVEQIEGLYRGMRRAADLYGLTIVGGDTSAARQLTISVTMIGEVETLNVAYRRGAGPGDILCVTGDLGAAYAGLKVLLEQRRELEENRDGFQPQLEEHQYVIQRQLVPRARLDVVRDWHERGVKPQAVIDLSDGLASDLGHLCRQSGCGAELHVAALPIAIETRHVADRFEEDVDTFAMFGGEDYELLFAAAQEDIEKMDDETYRVIGRFTAETDIMVHMPDGESFPLGKGGFDHFSGGGET